MKTNAPPATVDDPDFISVSALARRDNVSKQAISKRVKALVAQGRLVTRKVGRELLVHAPTFDQAKGDIDPAQALRNLPQQSQPEPPPPTATEAATNSYRNAVERKALAEAEKIETANAIRRGELLVAEDVAIAATKVGERIAAIVSGLKGRTVELYAAAQSGGEDAFHVALSTAVDSAVTEISGALKALGPAG
jgi:biotin operon repressor